MKYEISSWSCLLNLWSIFGRIIHALFCCMTLSVQLVTLCIRDLNVSHVHTYIPKLSVVHLSLLGSLLSNTGFFFCRNSRLTSVRDLVRECCLGEQSVSRTMPE
ncbi:hypothetical protein EDB89DRAFT_1614199 [Lactarius sanguifluus]|nr:hypothetical protein EDB89DRAFT_1614199 [Lactarius sanguifluus]